MPDYPYNMVTILGPTASGKTSVAVHLADELNSEIISADSRQVYREMNIGTGKDYGEYVVNNRKIPCHLTDIRVPGEKYNVFEFQQDFVTVFNKIRAKGKIPVLCGGSGMYIEAVVKGYKMLKVPENKPLRNQLEHKTLEELAQILASYKTLHNITDIDTRKRAIRAIEIEEYHGKHTRSSTSLPEINSLNIGIYPDRETRRKRISQRLFARLEQGMVDEVQRLLDRGVLPEDLIYYGLEYKYITEYLTGKYDYNTMTGKLETGIHQFAKRQMTWFRGMERKGVKIHWIDGLLPAGEIVRQIMGLLIKNTGGLKR